MTTVNDILAYLEILAPAAMKEDWDNVGLNCGHRDRPVRKILLALDPFAHVCREAKDWGADLLLTHHALIWKPGFVTDSDVQGRNTLFLIENGIAHINAHTNLDMAPGGVNDVLADTLGLQAVEIVNPKGIIPPCLCYGLLRSGYVEEQPLEKFLGTVKTALHCEGLRYVDAGNPVHKVAVGGGACGGAMYDALAAGCDTFVTSDLKYNQFWDAREMGLNLIDAGHFHTENPAIHVLAEKIAAMFPDLEIKISESHGDCMKFY